KSEADQETVVRQFEREPRQSDRLHPGADRGDDLADKEQPIAAVAQRPQHPARRGLDHQFGIIAMWPRSARRSTSTLRRSESGRWWPLTWRTHRGGRQISTASTSSTRDLPDGGRGIATTWTSAARSSGSRSSKTCGIPKTSVLGGSSGDR